MNVATPVFSDYVLPLTIVVLISIFAVQRHGTARVATFFGPMMVIFFVVIGFLGAIHIPDAPRILLAFDPLVGIAFLFGHGLVGFIVLGSVFLRSLARKRFMPTWAISAASRFNSLGFSSFCPRSP